MTTIVDYALLAGASCTELAELGVKSCLLPSALNTGVCQRPGDHRRSCCSAADAGGGVGAGFE